MDCHTCFAVYLRYMGVDNHDIEQQYLFELMFYVPERQIQPYWDFFDGSTGSGSGLSRIRRHGHSLKCHPTGCWSRGSNSGPLGARRVTYPLHRRISHSL